MTLRIVLSSIVSIILITSGLSKVIDIYSFAEIINQYISALGIEIDTFFCEIASIILISLEVTIGICILVSKNPNKFYKMALLLFVFFASLTLYISLNGNLDNCGCFGSFFITSPQTSFFKNLVLIGICAFLIKANTNNFGTEKCRLNRRSTVLIAVTMMSFCFVCLNIQPLVDTTTFKEGDLFYSKNYDQSYREIDISLLNNKTIEDEIGHNGKIIVLKDFNQYFAELVPSLMGFSIESIDDTKDLYLLTTSPAKSIPVDIKNKFSIIQCDKSSYHNLMSTSVGIIQLKNGHIQCKQQVGQLSIFVKRIFIKLRALTSPKS